MDIRADKLIGVGNTAEVFDIGDNRVLKLFRAGYPRRDVETEFEKSRLINHLGLPIPRSYEIAARDDRYGIVYDKIEGASLLDIALRTRDVETYAPLLASLHRQILSKTLPSAVSFNAILRFNIENARDLDAPAKRKVLDILGGLPEGDGLCHGDFHFGNILLGGTGIHIIDFMNICRGHRYLDIARTVYLTELTPAPEGIPDEEKLLELKRQVTDVYLKEMGVAREDLSRWLTVIVAARLAELSDGQTAERGAVMRYLSSRGLCA